MPPCPANPVAKTKKEVEYLDNGQMKNVYLCKMKTVRNRGVTDDKRGTNCKSAPAGKNNKNPVDIPQKIDDAKNFKNSNEIETNIDYFQ